MPYTKRSQSAGYLNTPRVCACPFHAVWPVEAARAVKMWKTEKQVSHICHKRVGKLGPQKTRSRVSHSSHKALLLASPLTLFVRGGKLNHHGVGARLLSSQNVQRHEKTMEEE